MSTISDRPDLTMDAASVESDNHKGRDENEEEDHYPSTSQSCGRGIVRDAKTAVIPNWWKQMSVVNQKTIGVAFFMFFAAVAPAVTFGAVYAQATNNYFGPVEMLLSSAWCGIVYALIGGNPIAINGGTGPVLAFGTIVYNLSKSLDVPFLTFNAWTGVWVGFYMVMGAFFDANRIIRYATKFTDDIFALLISTIFIFDAIRALIGYFNEFHVSHEDYTDDEDYEYTSVALVSLILGLGTCWLAFFLKGFKFTSYLCNDLARSSLADFAVVASILLFTLLDHLVFGYIPTQQLNVPDTFAPTFECCTSACTTNWPEDCPTQAEAWGRRPWMVDLFEFNGKPWLPLAAAGPAILAFILLFLDNGITWHIINHPSHKISYGTAYNYDTCVMAFFTVVNSIFGIPWVTSSTTPSLAHYHALAEKDREGNIISVYETRLTLLLVHILILCCLFVLEVIQLIPMPVLYGVFLYMGLNGLSTNQMWDRCLLFFMQPAKYPNYVYVEEMKKMRVHYYTIIQLISFAVLYAVKSIDVIAIAFPIIIFSNIPIRSFLLPRIFTKDELVVLDGDDTEIEAYLAAKETVRKVDAPMGTDDGNFKRLDTIPMSVVNGDRSDDDGSGVNDGPELGA